MKVLRMLLGVGLCTGLFVTVDGRVAAQETKKAANQEQAQALKLQMGASVDPTGYTGSMAELGAHVVVNHVGKVYEVREANVLIASYSTATNLAEEGDNPALKYYPLSKRCSAPVVVTLPAMTAAPVTEACRRDLALGKAELIKAGTRVTMTNIDFRIDQNRMMVDLLEHHKSQAGAEAPRFISHAVIEFPVGFLASAQGPQVAAALKTLLAPSGDPIMMQPYPPAAPLPAYSVEDRLMMAYRPMVYDLANDTSSPATVLQVKADRYLRALTPGIPVMGCVPTVVDGHPKDLGMMCKAMMSQVNKASTTVFIKPEDQLTVQSFKLELKKDKELLRLEVADQTQPAVSSKFPFGVIEFEFPKGTLEADGPAKVSEQIAAVFNVKQPEGMARAGGGPGALPGAGPAAPPPPMEAAAPAMPAAPPQSLEEQLKSLYKLTVVDGKTVTTRGSVLTVANDKLLLGTSYIKPAVCAATVVEGAPKPAAAACVASQRAAITRHEAKYFAAGQRLNVTGIKVDTAKETVSFALIDDSAASPQFRTAVDFVFAKGFLEGSDAGQVGETVNAVLTLADAATK